MSRKSNSKTVKITGKILDIVDTSETYVTGCNTLVQTFTIGVKVKIGTLTREVPIVKVDTVNENKIKEISKKLKEKYGIEKDKTFTFELPSDRTNMNEVVETTGYKHNVPGNVDKMIVFRNRTLINNRIRKALLKGSRTLSEEDLI